MRNILLIVTVCIGAGFASLNAQTSATTPTKDRSSEVMYFHQDEVAASFQKGGTLAQGTDYKVMTAKRDAPGEVEIHAKYTDVFYVVAGNATIVVGGQMVGGKSTEPDELRGASIDGGQVHHLSAGDVIIIPAGIPHWINTVDPPFHYFVVKIATISPQQ
jgi:mannose-6-phosphate isomerase-like protein (cupin superfamily)